MIKYSAINYQDEAGATDEQDYSKIQARMSNEFNAKMLHYAMGMNTEAAEFIDNVKKTVIYGKEFDKTNAIEELGDQLWYISRALETLGSTFEEAMSINMAKLKARYGDKFTEEKAINRDLNKERKALENGQ
jgi:NTP pyrophosphatase (non-canonical NTP hydrolase)